MNRIALAHSAPKRGEGPTPSAATGAAAQGKPGPWPRVVEGLCPTPQLPPQAPPLYHAAPGRWHPGLGHDVRHTELFASADEASGVALALALAQNMASRHAAAQGDDHRPWLWVQDKTAIRLSGRPYRPGLPEGLRHRLIHVAADKPADALFALEEGLRCRDLAFVIGEMAGNPAALDFTASRRLSLAAQRHDVPLWLVRLSARHDLGSARMRWDVAPAPSAPRRWNPVAPGDPRWQADLFRAHVFQPGQWILGDDSERAELAVFTPDHGGMVSDAGDRSLASVQPAA